MLFLHLCRLLATLLLATILLASPALDVAPVAIADNGNEGHNGDDNPGQRNGKNKHTEKDNNEGKGRQVEAIPAGYTVAIDCRPGEDAGTTACAIAATAPEGGKEVGFVQIPAAALCAEVVNTDAEFVDPDPITHITGYKSRGSKASLTLTLDSEVTATGTATYWIMTGGSVFPVEGPGLTCNVSAAGSAPTVTAEVSPTTAPATGTVVVAVLTCGETPADTTAFDWFGACQPGADPARDFSLAPSDGSAALVTATTDAGGEATFGDVAPGEFRLDLVDGSWCHANADRVTADSEVVVEAGTTSTVWIFLCEPPAGV